MATLTTSYQKIGTGTSQKFGGTTAYIELYAKYNSQSISNNNTNYTIEARLVTSNGYIGEYTGTSLNLKGNGINSTKSCGTGNFTSKTLGSASGTTTHASDGTNTVNCSASIKFSAWGITLSVSGSADLPKIPRYASITKFEVNKRDETSVTVNWGASDSCDAVWYSIDNGNWISTSGTSFVISGLSANTTYNIKIRVRRTDSQLTTDSSNVQQTTYNYPYVISMSKNNLIIGEEQTLNLYNPLNRTVIIKMFKDSWSGTVLYTGTGSGTTHTFTPDKNTLYASIPNSKSAYAIYSVRYNNVEKPTLPNNQTYSINESECMPTFNDFAYEDTNSDIINLTGNNQVLVDNYSNCKFNITERATAKNSARIDSYVCYYGDNYITYIEQIMGLYWKIFHPERFSIPFDTTTNMNTINCSGADGWECIFFPVKTIAGKTYKFTFDYRNPNGYTSLSGKAGIPCQILTRVDDNDNTGNQITAITLSPTANQNTQHLEVQFTATTSITYINFNFGYASDGVTTTIYLGNFKLNDINGTGNILKVQAIDSRGLSTTVSKTITNIPYKNAFINELSTERKNGVDSKTFLAGKFTVYNGSWDGTNVENSQNRLKYVGYSVYKNNAWSNYYDITNDVLSVANVITDGNNKIYEFDYDDEIQIHENGASGGFILGTEFQIRVLIKDGNNSYIFIPTNYEALFNTNVSDGTVATCLHKDRNGLYHFGINCMSDDDYMFKSNDTPIIDNDGNLILNKKSITDIIYPVGSLYMSVNSTSPETLFGGTWERMTGGFIYGCITSAGNGNGTGTSTEASTGNTGGPSNNTSGETAITTKQMPSHSHNATYTTGAGTGYESYKTGTSTTKGSANYLLSSTGGGEKHTHTLSSHTHSLNSHTHKIPYMAVFIWKRTA